MICPQRTSKCTGIATRESRIGPMCDECWKWGTAMGIQLDRRRIPRRPSDWRSRFGFRRRSDRLRESWARRLWVRA